MDESPEQFFLQSIVFELFFPMVLTSKSIFKSGAKKWKVTYGVAVKIRLDWFYSQIKLSLKRKADCALEQIEKNRSKMSWSKNCQVLSKENFVRFRNKAVNVT